MADQQAVLKTNRGDIAINLFPNHAPETVANFVGLAEGTKEYRDDAGRSGERFYDGLTLPPGHRRLHDPGRLPARHRHRRPRLHVQGRVPPRAGLRQALPAGDGERRARAPTARSSSSPSAPTTWLNFKHTIFGEVADQASRDVVDAIATTATGPGDRPVEPVVIESVEVRALLSTPDGPGSGAPTPADDPAGVPDLLPAPRPRDLHPLPALRQADLPGLHARRRRGLPVPRLRRRGRQGDPRRRARRTAGCGRAARRDLAWS